MLALSRPCYSNVVTQTLRALDGDAVPAVLVISRELFTFIVRDLHVSVEAPVADQLSIFVEGIDLAVGNRWARAFKIQFIG